MVQLVITSLLRSEGPRFEPGWNHFYMLLHCTLPLLSLFSTYTYRPVYHTYLFLFLSLVGSYQVGYTRSHPNTEVKMLRACSVPLCSHRWERQVIYLLFFFIITTTTVITTLSPPLCPYSISYPDITVPDICLLYTCAFPLLIPSVPLLLLSKRRAWQGSNLQSSDSQSDAFPLRHRPSPYYIYSLLQELYLPIPLFTCLCFYYRQVHIKQDTPVPIRTRK